MCPPHQGRVRLAGNQSADSGRKPVLLFGHKWRIVMTANTEKTLRFYFYDHIINPLQKLCLFFGLVFCGGMIILSHFFPELPAQASLIPIGVILFITAGISKTAGLKKKSLSIVSDNLDASSYLGIGFLKNALGRATKERLEGLAFEAEKLLADGGYSWSTVSEARGRFVGLFDAAKDLEILDDGEEYQSYFDKAKRRLKEEKIISQS